MTLGLAAGTVRLRQDHFAWAAEFRRERDRLGGALPAEADIRHVGSTAVPGVPAKPILDILVGVRCFEDAAAFIEPLERLGYTYRGENGIARRHYFVRGEPRTHHLHMVEHGSAMWIETLLFRDFLRSSHDAAREYAAAKRRLAEQYAENRKAYQKAKDRTVECLSRTARDWSDSAEPRRDAE